MGRRVWVTRYLALCELLRKRRRRAERGTQRADVTVPTRSPLTLAHHSGNNARRVRTWLRTPRASCAGRGTIKPRLSQLRNWTAAPRLRRMGSASAVATSTAAARLSTTFRLHLPSQPRPSLLPEHSCLSSTIHSRFPGRSTPATVVPRIPSLLALLALRLRHLTSRIMQGDEQSQRPLQPSAEGNG
jgi:hypothetical protein